MRCSPSTTYGAAAGGGGGGDAAAGIYLRCEENIYLCAEKKISILRHHHCLGYHRVHTCPIDRVYI